MSRSSYIWSHNMKSSNEVGPKGRGERVRHLTRKRLMVSGLVGLMLIAISTAETVRADNSIARVWDDQLLHAISLDTARPTVHARNLFDMSAAMYDAWSAYDTTSSQYIYHEKLSVPNVDAARNEAISYAAFGLINERFVSGPAGIGPGKLTTQNDLRQQMISLGYDPDNTTTVGNSPAAIGNRVAQAVINYGLNDGSREAQNYASPAGQYIPVNDPMTVELSGTVMNDPNRWQPLHFNGNRIDQFGNAVLPATQKSLTPFWGDVKPFAMTAADKSANGVYHDQGPQPHLGGVGDAELKTAIVNVLQLSSQLDPTQGVMIDISPASRGNSPLGSYVQNGYSQNPATGQPYAPEVVNQADFGRVVAEFWADGPHSDAPPGHWNEIGNYAADRMDQLGIPKKIGGTGPVVSNLEYDVKRYFAENGALYDASIAAWNHKGVYDGSRPVSLIRYMGQLGQSSDPNLTVDLGGGNIKNTYNAEGLPLVPGLIEVITPATTAPGQRHEALAGHEGEIAVYSWQGAIPGVKPFVDPNAFSGVGWILAKNWLPYQLSSFVTPPFPGLASGHSTFSRSAAEVLAAFTGTPYFPGGLGQYDIPQGSGLNFEYGPTTPLSLQWATYFDAADQAAISRIYGGIHPTYDDIPGRLIGSVVGPDAYALAMRYFAGQVPEPSSFVLLAIGVAAAGLWRRRASSVSSQISTV
jgi:PEP-CTERM motif